MPTTPAKNAITARARQLADSAWGWEDIYVHLRPYGMTEKYARQVVFERKREPEAKAS